MNLGLIKPFLVKEVNKRMLNAFGKEVKNWSLIYDTESGKTELINTDEKKKLSVDFDNTEFITFIENRFNAFVDHVEIKYFGGTLKIDLFLCDKKNGFESHFKIDV